MIDATGLVILNAKIEDILANVWLPVTFNIGQMTLTIRPETLNLGQNGRFVPSDLEI